MLQSKRKNLIKISRGIVMLIALKITFFGVAGLIQSCKKTDNNYNNGEAKIRFYDAINKNKSLIGSVTASQLNNPSLTINNSSEAFSDITSENEYLEDVYVQPPGGGGFGELPGSLSIQQMSDLVLNYNAVIQYTPSPTNHGFNVPINEVVSSLNPLLTEARAYLNTKGFTNEELNQMVIDSGAVEADLIPFAMVLASNEPSPTSKRNNYFSQFFGQSAYAGDVTWHDYLRCGLVAIGLQFAAAAGPSMTGSWSKAAMKQAFGAIAKRFLGPVGVAIAVVSFGVCIAEAYLD